MHKTRPYYVALNPQVQSSGKDSSLLAKDNPVSHPGFTAEDDLKALHVNPRVKQQMLMYSVQFKDNVQTLTALMLIISFTIYY